VKVEKGDSGYVGVGIGVGTSQNKVLADVTNLHQQTKQHVSIEPLLKVCYMYYTCIWTSQCFIFVCFSH